MGIYTCPPKQMRGIEDWQCSNLRGFRFKYGRSLKSCLVLIPSGDQTWQWKIPIYIPIKISMDFRDFQPCLITGGQWGQFGGCGVSPGEVWGSGQVAAAALMPSLVLRLTAEGRRSLRNETQCSDPKKRPIYFCMKDLLTVENDFVRFDDFVWAVLCKTCCFSPHDSRIPHDGGMARLPNTTFSPKDTQKIPMVKVGLYGFWLVFWDGHQPIIFRLTNYGITGTTVICPTGPSGQMAFPIFHSWSEFLEKHMFDYEWIPTDSIK